MVYCICRLKTRSGSALLLGGVSEVFPGEIRVRASRLKEKDQASPLLPPPPPKQRGQEWNRQGERKQAFPSRVGSSNFLYFCTVTPLSSPCTTELRPIVFPFLRLLASCWMAPATSLVPKSADGKLWDFSAYIIVWTNSCNITPHISIYTPQVLFLRKTIIQSQNSLFLPTGTSFLSIVLKQWLWWPTLLSFLDIRWLGKSRLLPWVQENPFAYWLIHYHLIFFHLTDCYNFLLMKDFLLKYNSSVTICILPIWFTISQKMIVKTSHIINSKQLAV